MNVRFDDANRGNVLLPLQQFSHVMAAARTSTISESDGHIPASKIPPGQKGRSEWIRI